MNITWNRTTEERYDEMMGVLPPAYWGSGGFLVGEAFDHRTCQITGRIAATYDAFVRVGEDFYNASAPLTIAEFRAAGLPAVVS